MAAKADTPVIDFTGGIRNNMTGGAGGGVCYRPGKADAVVGGGMRTTLTPCRYGHTTGKASGIGQRGHMTLVTGQLVGRY